MEKTFSQKIWYAFYSKFATCTNFENKGFFQKKQLFPKESSTFVRIWEILLLQSHSTETLENLLQFGYENFSNSELASGQIDFETSDVIDFGRAELHWKNLFSEFRFCFVVKLLSWVFNEPVLYLTFEKEFWAKIGFSWQSEC